MNRSQFLKSFIGIFGISTLPIEMVRQYQKIYLLQCFVRGFRFYEGPKIIHEINNTGLLEMVREPDNEFDENAIALHFNGIKIGFIPAESNEILARILDSKLMDLQVEINRIEPETEPWENVHIAIYALKEIKDNDHKIDYQKFSLLETPTYCSLKSSKDHISRVYYEEDINEDLEDIDFYQTLVENSSTDEVYSLIHHSFENPGDFYRAFDRNRIVVKRKSLPEELEYITQNIDDQINNIENTFSDKAYIMTNVREVSKIPDRIEKFVKVMDKTGNEFFELILKS